MDIGTQNSRLAVEKKKAIVFENLNRVDKGYRGDGKAKLRKRLSKWSYKSLLSKIERAAKQKAVEVIKVNPAYTWDLSSILETVPKIKKLLLKIKSSDRINKNT